MKKYAMVVICCKSDDNGNPLVRRVLISYSFKTKKRRECEIVYHRTRLLEVDPYFKNSKSSHQYEFKNDGYFLKSGAEDYASELIGKKRKYHYHDTPWFPGVYAPIEFKAKKDHEAIEKFNSRKKES